jgi:hypothetical protein
MDTSQDQRCRRCPRLGHEVRFGYCRTLEGNTVCTRILNCWWELFAVEEFLRAQLTDEEFAALAAPPPPKPKVLSLLELIEQAKKNSAQNPHQEQE